MFVMLLGYFTNLWQPNQAEKTAKKFNLFEQIGVGGVNTLYQPLCGEPVKERAQGPTDTGSC